MKWPILESTISSVGTARDSVANGQRFELRPPSLWSNLGACDSCQRIEKPILRLRYPN